MFDDPDRLVAIAQESFTKAKAIAENDRRGIPGYGAVRGKLVVRTPPKQKAKVIGPA
jgi:hypothetical protein